MTKTENDKPRGAGKVSFWARKESIEKMLEAKYSLMATFLAHEKDLNIGYQQFRRYVNEFIRSKPINEIKGDRPAEKGDKAKDTNSRKTEFRYDANSGNKDDLV